MLTIDRNDVMIHFDLPPKALPDDRVALDSEFFSMQKSKLHRPHGVFASLACTYDGINVYMIFDEKQIPAFFEMIDPAVHIYQNAMFDIKQLRRFADIPDRKRIWDTMVIEQIMYSGYYDTFALNDLARRYCGLYLPKEERKSFSVDDKMDDDKIFYAACDVIATWMVYNEQRHVVDDEDLNIWKNIERPAMWTLLGMGGVQMDVDAWLALAKINQARADELRESFSFNPASPKQVKEALAKEGYECESTNEATLESIQDECELAKNVLEFRKKAKLASTYGVEFIEKYVEEDGRIYSAYHLIGAECLAEGELVLTNRGYVPIESVKINDLVITHTGQTQKVTQTMYNGVHPIYTITLQNGLVLRTTGNHPFRLATGGWEVASNLRRGQKVLTHSSVERWKNIPEWDNYYISSWGRVYSQTSQHMLSQQPKGKWGHLKVMLSRNGARRRGPDRKDFAVHRLVADAFVEGKSEINKEVRHRNGLAWDNTDNNLLWGTSKENKQDAIQHGTMSHRHGPQAKLNEEMVSIIRQGPFYRGRDGELAKRFGISREMVKDVRLFKRWPDNYFDGKGKQVEFGISPIVSIKISDPENTYGLTIENDESHVTGGIVTHNTGRTSSSNPNGQNIVHDKEYRDCFVAGDGNMYIIADWSSQEPRNLAYLSQDEKLIEILNSGKDIYIEVGYEIFGERFGKKDERRHEMKAIILGLSYGMSKYGLAIRLGKSEDYAEELIEKFFEKFPGVREYLETQRHAKNYVKSIIGRKIWLNHFTNQWYRNALNGPIQASAADALKIAMSRFVDEWGSNPIIMLVHDEIVLEVPKIDADDAAKLLESIMISTAESMHDGINAKADVFIAKSWGGKG